jgi:outer membrane protein assembly factor BamD (BamD/ComL family)
VREIRVFIYVVLITLSIPIPISTAPQYPETRPFFAVSQSDDEELLKTVAALVRQSQYGSEPFGAAMREITNLLAKHHDSAWAPLLSAILEGMHEKDATHNFKVAMFYLYKRGSKKAAEMRLRHVVDKYPKYSRLDEVLYQLSQLEEETNRGREAIQTLERIIKDYEFSPRKREAKSKLMVLKGRK